MVFYHGAPANHCTRLCSVGTRDTAAKSTALFAVDSDSVINTHLGASQCTVKVCLSILSMSDLTHVKPQGPVTPLSSLSGREEEKTAERRRQGVLSSPLNLKFPSSDFSPLVPLPVLLLRVFFLHFSCPCLRRESVFLSIFLRMGLSHQPSS